MENVSDRSDVWFGYYPVEAALIAKNIAPGVFRKGFAFEKWVDFDADMFDEIYNDDSQEREFAHKITDTITIRKLMRLRLII